MHQFNRMLLARFSAFNATPFQQQSRTRSFARYLQVGLVNIRYARIFTMQTGTRSQQNKLTQAPKRDLSIKLLNSWDKLENDLATPTQNQAFYYR